MADQRRLNPAIPVVIAVIIPLALAYAFMRTTVVRSDKAIGESDWQVTAEPGHFEVRFPGSPQRTTTLPVNALGIPEITAFEEFRTTYDDAYFSLQVIGFPSRVSPDMLRRLGDSFLRAEPGRTLSSDRMITLEGRQGREVEFTRPNTSVQMYIDNNVVYVLATDRYVLADQRRFFGSFRFLH